jgi:hypothetical protein
MRVKTALEMRPRGFLKLVSSIIAVGFAFTVSTARAQDAGAHLDLLVKKRIITDQEAE